jgi:hypothetical protein
VEVFSTLEEVDAMIADVRADESDLADRLTVKTLDLETPAN